MKKGKELASANAPGASSLRSVDSNREPDTKEFSNFKGRYTQTPFGRLLREREKKKTEREVES